MSLQRNTCAQTNASSTALKTGIFGNMVCQSTNKLQRHPIDGVGGARILYWTMPRGLAGVAKYGRLFITKAVEIHYCYVTVVSLPREAYQALKRVTLSCYFVTLLKWYTCITSRRKVDFNGVDIHRYLVVAKAEFVIYNVLNRHIIIWLYCIIYLRLPCWIVVKFENYR